MQREFSDIAQNQRGLLRVGVGASRGRVLLPGAISRFRQGYPNITVELAEGSNRALHQMLLSGALDIAIADFPEALEDVSLSELCREEVVLLIDRTLFQTVYGADAEACARSFRAGDFSRLADCPLVMGTADDIDGRIGLRALRDAGIEAPRIRAVSHNVGMLLALCAEGVGACFCPESLARAMLSAADFGALMRFRLGSDAGYAIRFGCRKHAYQWSAMQAFMDCARDAWRAADVPAPEP